MKNLISFMSIIFLSSLTLAHAMNVSVVIQFPSQTEIYLVNVSSNATAKDALIATGLNTTWSYGGSFLDCISGICGRGSVKWWCFTYKENGKWVFSNVGLNRYKCKEGDTIGLRFLYGESSSACFKCFSACDYATIEKYCAPSYENVSMPKISENTPPSTFSKHIYILLLVLILILLSKKVKIITKK